jgi:transcriptional regulator with XRE-family HTH domain
MKTSSASKPLPFVVEDALTRLGQRVSLARRARGMTQSDLAAKAGVSLSTMLSIEKGAPTVQVGYTLMALWALGLEGTFETLSRLGSDEELSALMAEAIPLRVHSRRARKVAPK